MKHKCKRCSKPADVHIHYYTNGYDIYLCWEHYLQFCYDMIKGHLKIAITYEINYDT